MAKQPGTFADLYEVEKTIKSTRPGRPRRKRPRKQVTVYLTQEQEEALSDLHYRLKKQFKLDRSDLVGLAIETLTTLLTEHNIELLDFQNLESLKFKIAEQITKRE